MKLSIYIIFVVGLIFILGAFNKKIVAWARMVGHTFAFLQRGSSVISRLDERSKDLIAKGLLIWIGVMLISAAVLAVFSK